MYIYLFIYIYVYQASQVSYIYYNDFIGHKFFSYDMLHAHQFVFKTAHEIYLYATLGLGWIVLLTLVSFSRRTDTYRASW